MRKLSVIIPAYDEQSRIERTLKEVLTYLDQHHIPAEVIVVDDGSKDLTAKAAKRVRDGRVSVYSYKPNQGKGFAIKTGVKHSTGDVVLFLDADHSIPIDHLDEFLPAINKYDLVIGSKALGKADAAKGQKSHRTFLGRCFNFLVRLITGVRFRDTQCGFKLFRGDAARRIFKRMRVHRFSFDVEALFLAKKYGYKIKELPIRLTERETSRVSIVFDSLSMLKDVLLIRWRDLIGLYR